MAKKPQYSQGQYIIRKRSLSSETGNLSPWSYLPDVFDDLEDAQYQAEDMEVPDTAMEFIVEVLDVEGNVVGGAVYSD